ncbi:hypothetical protein H7K28_15010 [Paenibacillus polymyxa]|jgi:hypothetical protein|uniref:YopX family protein n=1 Tax=Paenibacillus polymyxa TaxID=1406 RepID=UPI00158129DD|nr:YopX family protein [Paenibacillus polymyxa]MBY0024518.1 hypothetical protein [Paenibacillus polymyxa]MBY0058646.1 hypothetical protein [Paenibacillus polymyxa]MBY0071232.1 hypothetical protein [Paenibacillus polymyxa]MBY0078612.1 hypothetical protein [Paenibacillus polymyxa]MBZ6441685.1 YopX family protein [Paenibacillus polymyxa]
MRELKYKFWDREEKRMIGPNLDSERYYIGSYNGLALFDTERKDEDGYTYQMDVEFLQYTGLKDRNGKAIYESDDVKFNGRMYRVTWSYGRFIAITLDDNVSYELHQINEDCEVFGSSYENPSLLEDTP